MMRTVGLTSAPVRYQGFTLIEVVVSLAILALALGVLYQSLGLSLRRTATLASEQEAWLIAQSLLSEVRARPILAAGASEGATAQGVQWHTRLEARADVDAGNPLQAFEVTIEVRWGARAAQRVRLQSIEIGKVRS